jgi:two-component system response regulator HydG
MSESEDAMVPRNGETHLDPTRSSLPRGRVLLVDDDAKDLKHFSTLLGRLGYSVQAFADHRQAEASLEHGYFDLVLICQGSPVLEMHRLTRFTVGRNRYTPVVVLTRCPEIESYVEAMQLGAADYVEKPLSPAELERLVTTYCKPQQIEISASRS